MGKLGYNEDQFTTLYKEEVCGCGQPDCRAYPIDDNMIRIARDPEIKKILKKYSTKTEEKDQMDTVKDDQAKIDAEVREAIAAPRRAAEVERRKAQLLALYEAAGEDSDIKDTFEVGTVLRWKRDDDGKVNTYVVVKLDKDQWVRSGGNLVNGMGYVATFTWESLVEHLATGKADVQNLQVVGAWNTIF